MQGITLSLQDAKELAWALVPHTSDDKVTPVLRNVALGGDLGNFAYATDRYTVGRFDLTNMVDGDMPTEMILIPGKALAAVRSLGPTTLPNSLFASEYLIRFETIEVASVNYVLAKAIWRTEDQGDMVQWMRSWLVPTSVGNFPPVSRLFTVTPGVDTYRTHLMAEHVDKFTRYAAHIESPIRITLTERVNQKDSPVLVEIGRRFKGLIQPTIVLDSFGFGDDLAFDNAKKNEASE